MLTPLSSSYSRVADSDESDAGEAVYDFLPLQIDTSRRRELIGAPRTHPKRRRPSIVLLISFSLLVLSTIVIFGQGFEGLALALSKSEPSKHQCTDPRLRREWRDLSPMKQQDYIKAAQCFSTLPNPYRSNGTLYDEFSRVHRSEGSFSHESASFLPWHRYLLHIYEKTLIAECDFRGSVPYWDWTLDYQDFKNSPIWDPYTGFGGNGNTSIGQSVGKGNCVTDGPFSTLRPVYYNQSYNPHCLSRGFGIGNDSEEILIHKFDPVAIEQLLRRDSYEGFLGQLEGRIHDSIHRLVGGDFRAWTAPNDPIFYLHHAQLDHLWWRWQLLEPKTRLAEYTGRDKANSIGNASLTDRVSLDTLAVDVGVEDVMSTQGKLLCYDYV